MKNLTLDTMQTWIDSKPLLAVASLDWHRMSAILGCEFPKGGHWRGVMNGLNTGAFTEEMFDEACRKSILYY